VLVPRLQGKGAPPGHAVTLALQLDLPRVRPLLHLFGSCAHGADVLTLAVARASRRLGIRPLVVGRGFRAAHARSAHLAHALRAGHLVHFVLHLSPVLEPHRLTLRPAPAGSRSRSTAARSSRSTSRSPRRACSSPSPPCAPSTRASSPSRSSSPCSASSRSRSSSCSASRSSRPFRWCSRPTATSSSGSGRGRAGRARRRRRPGGTSSRASQSCSRSVLLSLSPSPHHLSC